MRFEFLFRLIRVASTAAFFSGAICSVSGSALAAEPVAERPVDLPVILRIPLSGKMGNRIALADKQGNLLHAPDLVEVGAYSRLGSRVLPMPAKAENDLWGYMDAKGAWAVTPQYLEAYAFSEDGVARVNTKTGWGFLGSDLKLAIPAKFESVNAMLNGRAAFMMHGKWGYLDLRGETIVPPRYDTAAERFDAGGLAIVAANKKFGLIDQQGTSVLSPKFDMIGPFGTNGLARVAQGERWGYIDRQGKLVIPLRYSLALDFGSSTLAAVESDDKWGLIDTKGAWVVKPIYNSIHQFNTEGLAPVWDDQYAIGFLNTAGKLVISPARGMSEYVRSGLIRFGGKGDALVSYVDKEGKVAIKGPFDWGSHFQNNGFALARRNGKWGILSRQGQFIVPPHHVEPLTVDGKIVGFDSISGLAPWISSDRAIEWLDAAGKMAFRIESSLSAKGEAGLRLRNGKGDTLWQDKSMSRTLASRPYFEVSAQELLHHPRQWTDIAQTAQALLKAKPRKFVAQQGWDLERDPYVIPNDADNVKDALRHGAIQYLAVNYLPEDDWGSYYFLEEQRSGQFKKLYETLKAQLTEAFGPPDNTTQALDTLSHSDSAFRTAWSVGKQRLVLEWTADYGDGDITYHLALAAIQTKVH